MSGASKADLQRGLARCRLERQAAEDRAAALDSKVSALRLALLEEAARADAAEAALRELQSHPDLRDLAEAFPDVFPALPEV